MAYGLEVCVPLASGEPAPAGEAGMKAVVAPALVPDAPPVGLREDDDGLLQRIGDNDQAAFRMLVERHIDRAYSIALRILGNAADAEDVVQDTFLKVWTHRGRWEEGRAKFSTWLYLVITNRCIDLRRRPRGDDMDAVPEPVDPQPDAVSAIQRNEVTSLLENAIERLPEQQRVAVILSYHEDMSNSEIAEVMNTTVSAVESLLKRGRQQLKAALRQFEGDIRQSLGDC